MKVEEFELKVSQIERALANLKFKFKTMSDILDNRLEVFETADVLKPKYMTDSTKFLEGVKLNGCTAEFFAIVMDEEVTFCKSYDLFQEKSFEQMQQDNVPTFLLDRCGQLWNEHLNHLGSVYDVESVWYENDYLY